MAQSVSDVSMDSLGSSSAGDVLIRSTSIERSWRDKQPRTPHERRQETPVLAHIPPALPANKPAKRRSSPGAPKSGSAPPGAPQSEMICEQLPLPKRMDPIMTMDQVHLNMDSRSLSGKKAPSKNEGGREQEATRQEGNICTSQYTIGQKEGLRACLKQSHSAVHETPATKEVQVKPYQDITAETSEKATSDQTSGPGDLNSAGIIAAATAAAIATAAPILKAQSDLDAKIGSVSELISKLHADQHLRQSNEQQPKVQAQAQVGQQYRDRITHLENQLGRFMENLQQQQMDIQSHFISSAINTRHLQGGVCVHGSGANPPSDPANTVQKQALSHMQGDGFPVIKAPVNVNSNILLDSDQCKTKSPLETPAPRRFAPIPMSKDVSIPLKDPLFQIKENMDESKFAPNLQKGRFLEQILQHQESPLSQSSFWEKTPVTKTKVKTFHEGGRSFSLPRDPGAAVGHTFQGMNHTGGRDGSTVKKADDVLQEIVMLKKEMQSMLQEASLKKFDLNGGYKAKSSLCPALFTDRQQFAQPSLLQMIKAPKSMFEDAEKILREVKNDKKVLDDNLEAIIRAKDGSAIYSLISALTTNGDAVEEIRIKSTVDTWIKGISTEIEEEMSRNEYESGKPNRNDKDLLLKKKTQNLKCTKDHQERTKRPLPRTASNARKPLPTDTVKAFLKQSEDISTRTDLRSELQKKAARSKVCSRIGEVPQTTEEHLSQLYGKPIYQSHRSTLKKAPYLRFSSPSPKSKPQRPKVVECVRGVKLKSARTQTCSSSLKTLIASPKRHSLSPQLQHENQYLFSPSREMPAFSGPMEGHLIPMAIPLGKSQIDATAPHPSSLVVMKPQCVTVTTSVPPTVPKSQLNAQKPKVAIMEMKSEKKDPPKLTVQVLPSVDIDSFASDSSDSKVMLPSPEVKLSPVPAEPAPQTPGIVGQEDDYVAFPGTDFLEVTDISQAPDKEEEQEIPEAALEYNGWSEPLPHKYSGLPFPPTAPAPQPASDVLDGIIERRETIENRLINWVEQEIMARLISEMYPVQQVTVPNVSVTDSEESSSHFSDIVDAAGGQGLQLFVDTGVPVDSDLIRQFVNEAVAETVAVMLGEREERRVESVPASSRDVVDTSTKTPLATPQCTPPRTPSPPEAIQQPVRTPVLSPQSSLSEDEESKRKPPIKAEPKIQDDKSVVGTPAVTPASTPPRVATPTPPVSEQATDPIKLPSPTPPSPWGNAELPLEEENPSSVKEEALRPNPLVMSVAKDEEPESLVSVAYSDAEQSSGSLPLEVKSPSPVPSPSSSPTTEESSLTVTETETETPDRPISEGEILYSYGQLVAAKALAEGGMMFTNVSGSLCSTLRDAHEMDYDPPSEGQVIQRPHPAHRDPVLSLLVKLNQAPMASHQAVFRDQNSDDDPSLGELSEGQRPRLNIAAEYIMLGRSVNMDHLVERATEHPSRANLPRPSDRYPGTSLRRSEVSPGPLSIRELEFNAGTSQQPAQMNEIKSTPKRIKDIAKDNTPGILFVEPKPVPARIIHVGVREESSQQQGAHTDLDRTRIEASAYLSTVLSGVVEPRRDFETTPGKMSLTLPSMNEDDHPDSAESVHNDGDSSGADTF
ncbi:protein TALPID3 isoform X2 [Ambystoma mexicanum]|uniref:protein TALPID3 isoform X2 n=1 Tax=Ambystoma mexicanum TaxID=8296 RepID=UPI0037E79815